MRQATITIHRNWLADEQLQLVAMLCSYNGSWLWVRNRQRTTWELPGGHIEMGEAPINAAHRELYEETGAKTYRLEPLFDYTVEIDGAFSYARMFYVDVDELGKLPPSEIEEVRAFNDIPTKLTYKRVQPDLFRLAIDFRAGKLSL